jgi:hypothetical protein
MLRFQTTVTCTVLAADTRDTKRLQDSSSMYNSFKV